MDFKKTYLLITVFTALLFGGIQSLLAQQSTTPDDLSLGSIDFPTSAKGEAQQEFLTGVLALHSFWYPEARDHFQKARELDPGLAIAYWGEAMTHDHPIWEQHDQQAGAEVLQQLDKQIKNGTIRWTEREKEYIEAVRILYRTELDMDQRRNRYAKAMQTLSNQYPEDDEALAFAALAAMSVPSFNYDNPDVRDVVPIASDLEELYRRNPNHPGAIHYLIHVYDSKKFAEMGLRPARDYANIAYSSSHAIHMPSHIYKHLEMWNKVIESNIRAYKASVEWQQETKRPLKDRDFHSYRWLFEAYLEVNNVEKACEIIKEMHRLESKAQKNNEDLGRIPGVLKNLKDQYGEKTAKGDPECR